MLDLFDYRSKNAVFGLLDRLEETGYVAKDANGRIALLPKLTGPSASLDRSPPVSPPRRRAETEAVTLDEYLVKDPDHSYMLTVRGDSMIDAASCRATSSWWKKGPAEAERRRRRLRGRRMDPEILLRDAAGVRLEPANRKYKFIRPQRSLEIGGGRPRRHPQILSPGKSGDLGPNALPSWNRRIGRVGPTRRAVRPGPPRDCPVGESVRTDRESAPAPPVPRSRPRRIPGLLWKLSTGYFPPHHAGHASIPPTRAERPRRLKSSPLTSNDDYILEILENVG
jgi:hypothetical protein